MTENSAAHLGQLQDLAAVGIIVLPDLPDAIPRPQENWRPVAMERVEAELQQRHGPQAWAGPLRPHPRDPCPSDPSPGGTS